MTARPDQPAGAGPLLVIKPNTTASVTTLLLRHAQAAAGPAVQVQALTAVRRHARC